MLVNGFPAKLGWAQRTILLFQQFLSNQWGPPQKKMSVITPTLVVEIVIGKRLHHEMFFLVFNYVLS